MRLCAPHMVGRWEHPESVCGCLHDYAVAAVEDDGSALGLAARDQRDRRADDRNRLGAGVQTIRDRRNVHEGCQADAAVHVRAIEIGSLPANLSSLRGPAAGSSAPARPRDEALYFCLGPKRGMHFCTRTIPVEVILAPEISLTWPAGQVPSSTLMRCPSRKSPISCSRETCCANVGRSEREHVAATQYRKREALYKSRLMRDAGARTARILSQPACVADLHACLPRTGCCDCRSSGVSMGREASAAKLY